MVSKFCFRCFFPCHLKLCDPSLAPLEEGDGNRIVTLVIETLANVLEKKFDEGQKELGITWDLGNMPIWEPFRHLEMDRWGICGDSWD